MQEPNSSKNSWQKPMTISQFSVISCCSGDSSSNFNCILFIYFPFDPFMHAVIVCSFNGIGVMGIDASD